MLQYFLKMSLAVLCLSCSRDLVFAQQVREPVNTPAEWSEAYPPFRIAGNLYYVGTYELACYLVVSPQGHILINTGLASSAAQIKANVATLGYKLSDVKIILTNQVHYDHTGAMAAIREMTGARVMVNAKDAGVLEDGGRSDYAFGGTHGSFRPVKADRLLYDGDTIQLGGNALVMLHHPGHTKGSCSFLLTVSDERRSYKVLLANMPSIVVDQKFPAVKTYPEIARDYAYTLKSMKAIPFDIWLAAHAGQFALHDKHRPGEAYNPAAFIDREGYDEALKELREAFDKKAAER